MTHIEEVGSYGVMVSTLDFESSDPSSNLGGTSFTFIVGRTFFNLGNWIEFVCVFKSS